MAYGGCPAMGDARLWEARLRSPMGDARLHGMPVYGMHAFRRGTPMTGTPMRWSMGDARLGEARLWEMHAYMECPSMGYIECPVRCTPMGDTRLREMPVYGR